MTGTLGSQERPPVPWYTWLSALAVTSAVIGGQWDISWHRSIGRDAFLTPAHIAIYLCGILAAICCGYLIFSVTFGHSALRDASVRVWGFRGPLGAFVAAWGGFVMLASAPFDDWWHSAYGLDVKILSPPHVVLSIGVFAVAVGALLLVAAQRNRAAQAQRALLDAVFLYVSALVLLLPMTIGLEYFGVAIQHSSIFYRVVSIIVPTMLARASVTSDSRWAATTVAGIYTLFMLGFMWILPLFPAQPKLGPVFHPVTQFIPPGFPLLILAPAIVLDLLWRRIRDWNVWAKSALSGAVFLLVLIAVQWPFSIFLQSPGARNAIFGGIYFDYMTGPKSFGLRHLFYNADKTPRDFWIGMGLALLFAILSARSGFGAGRWMRNVRR